VRKRGGRDAEDGAMAKLLEPMIPGKTTSKEEAGAFGVYVRCGR
jgi:hypothetical protein